MIAMKLFSLGRKVERAFRKGSPGGKRLSLGEIADILEEIAGILSPYADDEVQEVLDGLRASAA